MTKMKDATPLGVFRHYSICHSRGAPVVRMSKLREIWRKFRKFRARSASARTESCPGYCLFSPNTIYVYWGSLGHITASQCRKTRRFCHHTCNQVGGEIRRNLKQFDLTSGKIWSDSQGFWAMLGRSEPCCSRAEPCWVVLGRAGSC